MSLLTQLDSANLPPHRVARAGPSDTPQKSDWPLINTIFSNNIFIRDHAHDDMLNTMMQTLGRYIINDK